MNPLITELQNAEWARVFGPTNTLGGELVRVERELARTQAACREPDYWRPAGDPKAVAPQPEAVDREALMGIGDWIVSIIGLAILIAMLSLPSMVILAILGVPARDTPAALPWLLPALYAAGLALLVLGERKKAARAKERAA